MARQKLLELTVTLADSTGGTVRTLRFVPGGGPGPDDRDLDQVVAMFWGQQAGHAPTDVLGGFYHHKGDAAKAQRVDLLWNGGAGAAVPQPGQSVPELPALMFKNPACDPGIMLAN